MAYYNEDILDILIKFKTTKEGLTDEEAIKRIKKLGKNEIKEKHKDNLLKIIMHQFSDLFSWLLIISAIITIILDKSDLIDSLLIISVVIFNAMLGVIQEGKASSALEKIKKLQSFSVKCYRDGQIKHIKSQDITIGDIVYLEEGDYVAADMRVIECENLEVSEATLTGESKPTLKTISKLNDNLGLADQKNMLFSSTFVTKGFGKAVVVNVGSNTEIGNIAKTIAKTKTPQTPMMKSLDVVTKIIGLTVVIICALVYGLELFLTHDMLGSFKSAVALSVAAIPEGLQTVITMVLAIGVLKLSKNNVIVKKMPAAETLGAISVIACDKTGTITTGKIKYYNSINLYGEKSDEVLKYACLATNPNSHDEINLAILEKQKPDTKPVKIIPFDSKRKMEALVYEDNNGFIAYIKGAFDIMFSLSGKQYSQEIPSDYANQSFKVLGVAKKRLINVNQNPFENIILLGYVILEEEIRPSVKDAIRLCKNAGILPIMITGDHVKTATAIAKKIDLIDKDSLIYTREMLEKENDEELLNHIDKIQIYARVNPLDKLRIINLWQKKDAIIAMTGDGVNDAAALKKADIGIAMGNATDITKDSSDIVLLNNDFNTILEASNEGRKMFSNVKKTIRYLLSSNIGEVLIIVIATILSISNPLYTIPLLPIHLLWINLVTDTLPAISLGQDNDDVNHMEKPPRKHDEGLLNKRDLLIIILEGIVMSILCLIAFKTGRNKGISYARTMSFTTICLIQLVQSYNVKNNNKINKNIFNNFLLNISTIISLLLMILPLFVFNKYFEMERLDFKDLIICVLLSLSIWIFSFLINRFKFKKFNT